MPHFWLMEKDQNYLQAPVVLNWRLHIYNISVRYTSLCYSGSSQIL